MKLNMSEVGSSIAFLGLSAPFPAKDGDVELLFSPTPEKAARWTSSIRGSLKAGVISSQEIVELIGNLRFPQTCFFGKAAMPQIRRSYRNLRSPKYTPQISRDERLTLRWRVGVLATLRPRIPRAAAQPPEFALFPDDATKADRVASLLFRVGRQLLYPTTRRLDGTAFLAKVAPPQGRNIWARYSRSDGIHLGKSEDPKKLTDYPLYR